MAKLFTLVGCFVMIIYFNALAPASSASHSIEWSLGKDYTLLATAKNYAVGDTIVFNYGAGHTVDEVSESDYKGCTLGNSISSDSSGTTSIDLKTSGPRYFICGIPGHCTGGMKLSVNVATTASSGGSGGGGDGATTAKNPPSESGKVAPSANSATAVLKPLDGLVAICVAALFYVLALL
ncbi:unnamed protein product [Cochlearia groenlandica]